MSMPILNPVNNELNSFAKIPVPEGVNVVAKRLLDIFVASAVMIVFLPFLPLLAFLIKVDSSGSVFFKQTRVGINGKLFTMWKFRTMHSDAEKKRKKLDDQNQSGGGIIFKMVSDPRITRVGCVLRKTSIDELPQLWNVLIGDMSLVGPRPALPSEVAQYDDVSRQRLQVKPGITCLWQISGRSFLTFPEQVALDLNYIRRQSLLLDLSILLKTVPAVVTGYGAF